MSIRIHTIEEYLRYEKHWEPTRSTGGTLFGTCPFHYDHTPSFSVVMRAGDPAQHFFRCHSMSCGVSGKGLYGIIRVDRFGGVDNQKGILAILNELTGTHPPSSFSSQLPVPLQERRRVAMSLAPPLPTEEQRHLMTAALAWWSACLFENTQNAKATRAYIAGRGLDLAWMRTLKTVGYAPYMSVSSASYRRFTQALEDACGKEWLRVAQSLGIFNEKRQVSFQHRLIVAQPNPQGEIISLQGRTLQEDYLQTKTPKFLMATHIRKVPFSVPVEQPMLPGTIFVESYFGNLALAQPRARYTGLRNVSSLGGSGIIPLEDYDAPIIDAHDHDLLRWSPERGCAIRAGDEHARKHRKYCQHMGIPYRRVRVPLLDKDVDAFILHHGPLAFVELVQAAQEGYGGDDENEQGMLAEAI